METFFFTIILTVLIGGFALLFWYLRRKDEKKDDPQGLLLLQSQLNELTRAVDTKLSDSVKLIQQQFGESTRIIREITQELTKVAEGQRQVSSVADQLKSLQDILKNPKQRGVLGEYYLETVLRNVLPPGLYQMQYSFKDGTKVDAVIFYQDKIIPIDSKFSLENYNRILEVNNPEERKRYEDLFGADLKTRIDETSKYIKPAEGTYDFALMFIPSEALYYDLQINRVGTTSARNLLEYAGEKHVAIVSPNTFWALLQTILQGLKQIEFNKSAEQIRKNVGELGRHIKAYEIYMRKLGSHLGTTVGMYENAYKELSKIDKDVLKITGKAVGIEPKTLERPRELDELEAPQDNFS